jgi:hypothetical protein
VKRFDIAELGKQSKIRLSEYFLLAIERDLIGDYQVHDGK